MLQFFLGLILTILGAAMTVKSESMLNAFGKIAFFYKYLGTESGSRLGYKLTGMLFFFIGVLTMTGLIGGFIFWIFGPLIRISAPTM